MSNKFRLIKAGNPKDENMLISMHRLRYQVFHRELKWATGLSISDYMEHDEYDRPDTNYIVRLNDRGVVDATCRLIPTNQNYMIADHYPDSVNKINLPSTPDIWEISRFCASVDARQSSKGKVMGQLIAASIEFGIKRNIKNYIALATDSILPAIRRIGGWDPQPIGDLKKTPDDFSYSVLYTVSSEMLQTVRSKNGIQRALLYDVGVIPVPVNEPVSLIA